MTERVRHIFGVVGKPSWPARAAVGMSVAGAIVVWFTTTIAMWAFHYPVLYHDQWPILRDYFRLPLMEWMYQSENGHRLLVPKMFYLADLTLFNGTGGFLVLSIYVLNVVLTATIVWATMRSTDRTWMRAVGVAAVIVFQWWLGNHVNLMWGIAITNYLPACATALALACLPHLRRQEGRSGVVPRYGWIAIILGLSVVATFSFGNGMAVWPTLLVVGYGIKLPRHLLLVLVLAGGVAVLAYMLGFSKNSQDVPELGGLFDPRLISERVTFTLVLLGSVFSTLSHEPSTIGSTSSLVVGGAMGCIGFAVLASWSAAIIRRTVTPMATVGVGVAGFVVISAIMIAFARAERYGISTAIAPRYLMWSSLFWAALLSLIPALCANARTGIGKAWPRVLLLLPLLMAPWFIITQVRWAAYSAHCSTKIAEGGIGLAVGVWEPEVMRVFLFNDEQTVFEVNDELRRRGWGLYAEQWPSLLGKRLDANCEIQDTLVEGGVQQWQRIESQLPGWSVSGWISRDARHFGADIILIADDARVIRGIARCTRSGDIATQPTPDVKPPLWIVFARRIDRRLPAYLGWGEGWYGYVEPSCDPQTVQYYTYDRQTGIARLLATPLELSTESQRE